MRRAWCNPLPLALAVLVLSDGTAHTNLPKDSSSGVDVDSLVARAGRLLLEDQNAEAREVIDVALHFDDLSCHHRARIGRMLNQFEAHHDAIVELTAALLECPSRTQALIDRADSLAAVGNLPAARADYSLAITLSSAPLPEWFVRHSDAWATDGELEEAVAALDAAEPRLGFLVVLQSRAADLERRAGKPDDCLKRIERILSVSDRKEKWHVLRAEILLETNRAEEATQALSDAEASLSLLSSHQLRTQAIVDLSTRIAKLQKALPPR